MNCFDFEILELCESLLVALIKSNDPFWFCDDSFGKQFPNVAFYWKHSSLQSCFIAINLFWRWSKKFSFAIFSDCSCFLTDLYPIGREKQVVMFCECTFVGECSTAECNAIPKVPNPLMLRICSKDWFFVGPRGLYSFQL